MFEKTVLRKDENTLFCFPLSEGERESAIVHIRDNGVDDFLAHSNIAYYAPNICPMNKRILKRLREGTPEEAYDEIERYVRRSYSLWSNPAAETIQNQHVNNRRLGYKVDCYGSRFLQGDIDALEKGSIRFPLLEEEMFIALEIIDERGIRFFIEHCAPDGLPECPYVKGDREETIENLESLVRWYGPYWLLGQLNDAAILNLKEKTVR